MRHCISAIWTSAFSAGTQSTTTHSSLPLTSSSYSLTSSSTSTHAAHFILSTSRKNTDTGSHNMALGMSLELELLPHTFLSTTFWEATEIFGRMDKGCPSPYLFRVQSQTKNLFQILFLFLLPFFYHLFLSSSILFFTSSKHRVYLCVQVPCRCCYAYLHLFSPLPFFDFSPIYEYIFIRVYKSYIFSPLPSTKALTLSTMCSNASLTFDSLYRTKGVPLSAASTIFGSNGTLPRKGTPNSLADLSPPPYLKMFISLPL